MSALTVMRVTALTSRAEGPRIFATFALPLVAFMSSTALALTVFGGYGAFANRTDHPDAEFYTVLAAIAAILIVIPCFTLGLAAARLGARRRDERLAALRLAGATPRQVVALSAIEAGFQGLLGGVLGAATYGACLPLVAQLPFQGHPFTTAELWVGMPVLAGTLLGVTVIAVISALVGLRAVVISPLGVAQRHAPPAPKWIIAATVVAVLIVWTQINPAALGIAGMLVALAVVFGAINFVGPFVVTLVGKVLIRRASSAGALVAARRILDDPKQVWRSVGGVTVASFVAAGTSLLTAIGGAAGSPEDAQLLADMRLGVAFTVTVTFGLAAISAVLTQVATILDNRDLYRNLNYAGTPFTVMNEARTRQVRTPVVVMSLIGAGFALGFLFPITGLMIFINPLALVQLIGLIAFGCGLVIAAVYATTPILRSVMLAGR
ncbi:hypothetical protein IEU95_14265 [Hoyosella rhizosphaerae]|uniref:ABC3 transporter permease C-terminal domain-containing protein n=1 Tax=Hoyosella rhizosphaerae TaxID=1755582 RepID=A0A916UGU8_9ACTN|nr:FtsX-like permease family protein [Hoyosella rhizosphaerae]MBN4928005.1 hypothetical protein [Hoyosella rhizosphaerae]GGC71645.1 hypothetical protein GCM10011410_25800 [Hoyosella rhizosphaerae]